MSTGFEKPSERADSLLRLPEAAVILRCSVKTVRRLITDGKLRSAKPRGLRLVARADIAALVAATTQGGEYV